MTTRRLPPLLLPLLLPLLVSASPATAQELMDLLGEGPVVMVKKNADGSFESATGVTYCESKPEVVWGIVADLGRYKDFMPQMERSTVKPAEGGAIDVEFEVEVPGSNPRYILRYWIDHERKKMRAKWIKGSLKHTYERWKVVPFGEGCLLYYTTSTKKFSSFAQAFEDKQQTITVGVNVSAALASIEAVKRRAQTMAPSATVPAKLEGVRK